MARPACLELQMAVALQQLRLEPLMARMQPQDPAARQAMPCTGQNIYRGCTELSPCYCHGKTLPGCFLSFPRHLRHRAAGFPGGGAGVGEGGLRGQPDGVRPAAHGPGLGAELHAAAAGPRPRAAGAVRLLLGAQDGLLPHARARRHAPVQQGELLRSRRIMLWGFLLAGCLRGVRCLRVGASKPLWGAVCGCSAGCDLRSVPDAGACADAGAQRGLVDLHRRLLGFSSAYPLLTSSHQLLCQLLGLMTKLSCACRGQLSWYSGDAAAMWMSKGRWWPWVTRSASSWQTMSPAWPSR